MSSSGNVLNSTLPDIKARLEDKDERGLHALFASVLLNIETVCEAPAEEFKTMDPKKAEKLIDLFASPTKPSLLKEYDRNYGSFMRFYNSLHHSDLKNIDSEKKKQIDRYADKFPTLIENLTNELKTMLEIDKDNEHQQHYTDLLNYLTQFKALIQGEEKRDNVLDDNSGPKSTV